MVAFSHIDNSQLAEANCNRISQLVYPAQESPRRGSRTPVKLFFFFKTPLETSPRDSNRGGEQRQY